jgi:hypothetical protein
VWTQSLRSSPSTAAPSVLFLLILMTIESIVFYVQVAINVAPFYPPNHDQTGHLIKAYDMVTTMRDFGIGAGLKGLVTPYGPHGAIFPLQGALLSLFLGVGRAGVLTVNLVLFLLLQLVMFWLVKWKTRRESDAWLSVALVLLLQSPFFFAGGIFDFRIDFFALCAFGIWTCVVLRSGVFRNLRWSVLAGLVGAWLVCTRYISFVYLAPILAVLLVAYAIAWLGAATRFRRAAAWIRSRNILVSGLIMAGAVSPFLWINRSIIYDYYFVSMFVSGEKEIRAQQLSLQSLWDHLLFYPKSVLFDHLGGPLLVAGGVLLIWSCLCIGASGRRGRADFWQNLRRQRHALLFLGATILVPLAFLNLSVHKSPVIGGILCVPFLLVILMFVSACRDGGRASGRDGAQFLLAWTSGIGSGYVVGGFVIITMLAFMYRAGTPKSGLQYVDEAAINDVYDKIIRYVVESGNASPSISTDRIADYLGPNLLMVASYERFGRLIPFLQMFPTSVLASSREDALALSTRSDIVILTDPVLGRSDPFPLNSAIRDYWGNLRTLVAANFAPLMSTTIQGIPLRVFVKPTVRISGISGNWVTSTGLIIEAEARDLAKWPFVVLEGDAMYQLLDGQPQSRAAVVDAAGQPSDDLPVTFEREGSRYVVTINAKAAASASTTPVRMQLTFDRHFVPRALGLNPDTRELVVLAPSRRELRSRPRD